jgi:hypothetical protein
MELQERWPRLFGASAEGARSLLSAIATSMLTVAGTVFSITLAVLSLAASQYSPRVLRSFMADRPTQLVLGVFVAVFVYCLVVLRTLRGGETPFIPSLAVLAGILLAVAAVAFLVFFIHHLATSIEASSILARITTGTLQAVEDLFPEQVGAELDESAQDIAACAIHAWRPVRAPETGSWCTSPAGASKAATGATARPFASSRSGRRSPAWSIWHLRTCARMPPASRWRWIACWRAWNALARRLPTPRAARCSGRRRGALPNACSAPSPPRTSARGSSAARPPCSRRLPYPDDNP